MIYHTKNGIEMEKLGEEISSSLHGGDVVLLYGDLGAGKTTLTKGIAKGLGVKKVATSPTFALMNIYGIKTKKHKNPDAHDTGSRIKPRDIKTLIHIDTYRLKDRQEFLDLGAEDYLGEGDCVCIIEWPDKIENLLPKKGLVKIFIDYDGKDKRKVEICK